MDINVSRTVNELIDALSLAIDIEEEVKLYHAWRVAIISAGLARIVSPEEASKIFYAALLHDIGSIGLPTHIVHYPARVEQINNPIILAHPLVGAEIASSIPGLIDAAKLIIGHHEWWNGHGYPLGKQANKIPLGCQILRIADAIDILRRIILCPGY